MHAVRKKLSIVSTVYYNEKSLPFHIEALREQRELLLRNYNVDVELIYVNDGSGDRSLEVLRRIKKQYPEWVKVVSFSRNFGAMRAVSAGLQYVSGDCFTVIASDLQDSPELLSKIIDLWCKGRKFITCIRKGRKDPVFTTLFSKTFNFLARKLIIKNYPKGGYDVFLLDSQYLPLLKNKGSNFNLQIYCYWLGIKPAVIYYDRLEREHGKSRWTFKKKLMLFIDSFVGFSTIPMRLAALIGLLVSTMSFIYGLLVFVSACLGYVKVPGHASIICLMSFLLGIIIFLLAAIAEYLTRIYDEVNKKPEYVIEEVF